MTHWNADKYAIHADFVSKLAADVLKMLDAKSGEKILDLGCGNGEILSFLKVSGVNAFGVDQSKEMIDKCLQNGLCVRRLDAMKLDYTNEFDAVFSNAVLHWIKDVKSVYEKVFIALKNGGRFVAEFGGFGNVFQICNAMEETFKENPNFGEFKLPWWFIDENECKNLLESVGFKLVKIEIFQRPTKIDDISNWLEIFANSIISHLDDAQKEKFAKIVKLKLKSRIYTEKEGWVADYVRLRFMAIKENA